MRLMKAPCTRPRSPGSQGALTGLTWFWSQTRWPLRGKGPWLGALGTPSLLQPFHMPPLGLAQAQRCWEFANDGAVSILQTRKLGPK